MWGRTEVVRSRTGKIWGQIAAWAEGGNLKPKVKGIKEDGGDDDQRQKQERREERPSHVEDVSHANGFQELGA